jgi:hypothetical protein
MHKRFPPISLDLQREDQNPAIQLFGRRFYSDQTISEYLIEFLLVASSQKRVGNTNVVDDALFPDLELLRSWPDNSTLDYAPKAHLNLKLFAFISSSKLETRHSSHRKQYETLLKEYSNQIQLSSGSRLDKKEVLKTLENLFLGFQGVGGQRTWCAASFMPINRDMLAGESIWRETRAAKKGVRSWDQALSYFSHSQRIFFARGGELLYLQLCNALRQEEGILKEWVQMAGLGLPKENFKPENLLKSLEMAITSILNACPPAIGQLANFLDKGVDTETQIRTDSQIQNGEPRFASCGWVPEENWREGYLFANELLNISNAAIDPIERLEMLDLACGVQVLRSLCAQGARFVERSQSDMDGTGPLKYVWVLSDPKGEHAVIKQISQRNLNAVQRLIYDAIRNPEIQLGQDDMDENEINKIYREADRKYGHKLFLTLAKRIGLVGPRRGAGARFRLNDKLVRFFVLAIIPPGERITYDSFKKLLFAHFGIAVDEQQITKACNWSGTSKLSTLGGSTDDWLMEMLDASGVLITLSDSHSLIHNPFDGISEKS